MFSIVSILDLLFPPRPTELMVRGLSIDDLRKLVAPTLIEDSVVETVSLLPYANPRVQAVVIEAKYHGNTKAQKLLGSVLSEYLDAYIEEQTALNNAPVVLVPIPLSKERRHSRGYNQVEEILRHASEDAHVDTRLLTRIRNTTAQTKLERGERLQNMKGVFEAGTIKQTHLYIVVDDVVTTGATLSSAGEALQKYGAVRIHAVALAH